MNPVFLTDRYQLAMLAVYARCGLAHRRAVFELYARRLPSCRRYMVSCGLQRALHGLQGLHLGDEELAHLSQDPFLAKALEEPLVRDTLSGLRFQGKVWAVPEGRLCFPGEPLLRVEASLAEAQLVETFLLSVMNHDVRVASKCARIVEAARGRPCFELGARRAHEAAAIDAARAACVAGFTATSHEEAARRFGLPIVGTMAHSYILAHVVDAGEDGEEAAFADFARTFSAPITCLVDTFDPLRGVERAARAVGAPLGGVRIDSGDLSSLAKEARLRLDAARLDATKIVLSDDLDEYRIAALLEAGTPVDIFGVGTMAVATPDAPSLGAVYKLVAMEDSAGHLIAVEKRAPGKGSAAGPKQVQRRMDAFHDTITLVDEAGEGEPLLELVLEGEQLRYDGTVATARARLKRDLEQAPPSLRALTPREETEGFPVARSARLLALQAVAAREGRAPLDAS